MDDVQTISQRRRCIRARLQERKKLFKLSPESIRTPLIVDHSETPVQARPSSRGQSSSQPSGGSPTEDLDADCFAKVRLLLVHRLSAEPIDSTVVTSYLVADLNSTCLGTFSEESVRSVLTSFAEADVIKFMEDGKSFRLLKIPTDDGDVSCSPHQLTDSSGESLIVSDASDKPCKNVIASDLSSGELNAALIADNNVEVLLSVPSAKEKENKKVNTEIQDLLNKPTARELSLMDKFKSDGSQMKEFCQHGTKENCRNMSKDGHACKRLHFRKIIQKHTDVSLGDCSFLNTCFHMNSCKYIHYEIDYGTTSSQKSDDKDVTRDKRLQSPAQTDAHSVAAGTTSLEPLGSKTVWFPPQWIQCDLRFFDLSVLGKFAVVMADPPWDIHMELPYGTMSDEEMRRLNVQSLQDEGLMFLWVTGRAMELGRECLKLWGYRQCDEIIWVKTNQLQRIIRTGRTGHWLNHGKEHCLVGVKGSLEKYNRGLDCDVIVAEVRATSHKPDEIYGIIERLSPGTRKIEIFGRQHNVQPNWITLGNQLDGLRLLDPEVVAKFRERYPDGNCMPKPEEVLQYKQRQQQGIS